MLSRSGLRSLVGAALVALTLGAVAPAGALEFSKHPKDSEEVNAIWLKGSVDDGDTYELQLYLASLPKKPSVAVYLNSPGGNLREGMRLGRFFYQNKIETVIEAKTACSSACALAFLGGRDDSGRSRRTKASTGGVGFHSFTRDFDKDKTYSANDLKTVMQMTQSQVSIVAEYLKAVGTDMDVLRIMLLAQNNDMTYLSNDEALALNIRVYDDKRNRVVNPEVIMNGLDRTTASAQGKPTT
jgi:hypothetical protein